MRRTAADKIVKGQVMCRFRSDCVGCNNYFSCVFCSGISKDISEYILQSRGYKKPVNAAMLKGLEKHKEYLQDFPTIEELGIDNIRNNLVAGKEIIIQEARLCNRLWGIRGVADLLEMKLEGNNFHVHITELKNIYWKQYLFQLAGYALIMSNSGFELVFDTKTKTGKRRVSGAPVLSSGVPYNFNVKTTLFSTSKNRGFSMEWMKDGKMSKFGFGITNALQQKMKEKRLYHKMYLTNINKEERTRQMFLGRMKPLVKTKPKVYKVVK